MSLDETACGRVTGWWRGGEEEGLQSDGTGSEGPGSCQSAASRPTAGHCGHARDHVQNDRPARRPNIRRYVNNDDNMLITIVTLVIVVVVILIYE